MRINELFDIAGWKSLCKSLIEKTGLTISDLEIDSDDYGNAIARRIFAKYGNKTVNDTYEVYKEMEGDDADTAISDDIALTYGKSWQSMLDALMAEYNPIENYDRSQYDYRTKTEEGSLTSGERSDTKGSQTDIIGSQTNTIGAHNDTHEQQKSAYDAIGYTADAKVLDNMASRSDTLGQHDIVSGQRTDIKGTETDTSHNHDEELFDSHVHGNIGITTNQQMITAEMELRVKFRFVDIVVKDIVNEMTLKCY